MIGYDERVRKLTMEKEKWLKVYAVVIDNIWTKFPQNLYFIYINIKGCVLYREN